MQTNDAVDLSKFNGTVIADHYRLDAFLAEGCFGGVFRASQLAYGTLLRTVAIKLAKRPMMDSEARLAFSDALLMARVADASEDPALRERFVTVFDAGRCPAGGPLAGHPFMVMEYVPGDTLAGRLSSGPFPLTRAIRCFDQLLDAVAFMHQPIERADGRRGPVIHRDIKPENILMCWGKDGGDKVKLTDFGCAFELDAIIGWTRSEGDLAYLAPESFNQEANSTQSDVYMLGLVLFEMLAGRNPFRAVGTHLRGDTAANRAEIRRIHLDARRNERFIELDTHPELRQRPALTRFLRQALAPDPGSRPYRDAAEMRVAWERGLADKPPDPLERAAAGERPWDTAQRLAAEADQCFRIGEEARGGQLLEAAQQLNRDPERVPDRLVVGLAYLLDVRRLLKHGATDAAGKLAQEGYRRRRCRATCEAMSLYCATGNAVLSRQFQEEAARMPGDD